MNVLHGLYLYSPPRTKSGGEMWGSLHSHGFQFVPSILV